MERRAISPQRGIADIKTKKIQNPREAGLLTILPEKIRIECTPALRRVSI
jgi:hypothetical protein